MGFFSKRKAFNALEEAGAWFRDNGIDSACVNFSTYDDPAIVKYPGASAIVGMGKKSGQSVGFVLEVAKGSGVLLGSLLPVGVASHHRIASDIARAKGRCLIDVLIDKARESQST